MFCQHLLTIFSEAFVFKRLFMLNNLVEGYPNNPGATNGTLEGYEEDCKRRYFLCVKTSKWKEKMDTILYFLTGFFRKSIFNFKTKNLIKLWFCTQKNHDITCIYF